MRWGLQAEEFEVACAADGQQALEAVFEVRPDLVVLDWELPALTGIEVCALIRDVEHSTGIPVVLVSGRYDADDIRRGTEAGADAYVAKPFAVESLAQEIRRVLDRSTEQIVLTQPPFTGSPTTRRTITPTVAEPRWTGGGSSRHSAPGADIEIG